MSLNRKHKAVSHVAAGSEHIRRGRRRARNDVLDKRSETMQARWHFSILDDIFGAAWAALYIFTRANISFTGAISRINNQLGLSLPRYMSK